MVERTLIVSGAERSAALLAELLAELPAGRVVTAHSCGEARRLLIEGEFDLVLVNAPLRDESGELLARHIAARGAAQVILLVRSEQFDTVSALCEEDGVLVVAKPFHRAVLWSALKLAVAAQSRWKRARAENSALKQRLEDIRVIDRAKCLLISTLRMSEGEAHRYIEKQAMDMRLSRRAIAEGILQTYEN